MNRRPSVAVIGNGRLPEGDPRIALAESVGRAVLDTGYRLVCGGLGGVMEAACRGARASERWTEGMIVGILPGSDPAAANRFVDVAIPTGLGHARNVIVAHADIVVMVGGATGTLSEAAFAATLGRPVIAVRATGYSGLLADQDFVRCSVDRVDELRRELEDRFEPLAHR